MGAALDMRQLAGLSVELRHGTGLPCYGGLNSIFLAEEGYVGGKVPVVDTNQSSAVVQLPSGYRLTVYPRDI